MADYIITERSNLVAAADAVRSRTGETSKLTLGKMIESITDGIVGGASSWNDLTDKPFGEETITVNEPLEIEWDGNVNGLVSVNELFYKIANVVMTDE